ncbi:MAG TPA: hypothetical protein VGN17_18385 [Bryobacteraceae bacterium]|jgi:hypothetical protein
MTRRALSASLIFTGLLLPYGATGATRGCDGSISVTSFRLTVQQAGTAAGPALPIRHLNNLLAGYRVSYRPMDLPADMKKDAKLTLVLVPKSADGNVTVLEPKLAATPGDWQIPFATRIAVLVFAPQGLDEKRLTNLVTKDDALAASLADYADETADLEAGLSYASDLADAAEENPSPRANTPAEQALFALVRALNPAVSSYDPLGVGRRAGPATMMGQGASAFFENAGGIVPGGGVLPMVKTWLLPDTEFRSVYAIQADAADSMTLCAKVQAKGKNKLAYLWAYRLQDGKAPALTEVKDVDLPLGLRSGVPVKLDDAAAWRPVAHIFDWSLVPESGSGQPVNLTVRSVPEERALQLDLRKLAAAPGAYHIQGKWDWDTVKVAGSVRLHRLDDLKTARLAPESQDRLVAATGPVQVDLTGADFLFVDHAWLHRPNNARQLPADLPAARVAPSDQLQVEIDTDGLRAGPYLLALSRIDGATTDMPLRVLPAAPRMDAPGPRVNVGQTEQRITFTGSGLDRLEKLDGDRAEITLQPATEDPSHRDAVIRIHADVKPGDKLAVLAKVEGMVAAVRFPVAFQVAAARPRIREAKASGAADLAVAVRDGEVPSGSWVSYALRVEPATSNAALTVQCADAAATVQPLKLHVGEKQTNAQLVAAGGDTLFLSLDPGAAGQSGCALTAMIETDDLGKSDPFALGKVVRLPRIESFTMTDEKSATGFYGLLKGFDLDTIDKTGWAGGTGVSVADLPRPVTGEGARQTLRIAMPWPSPSPKAPLFVWLRGETDSRATKVNP